MVRGVCGVWGVVCSDSFRTLPASLWDMGSAVARFSGLVGEESSKWVPECFSAKNVVEIKSVAIQNNPQGPRQATRPPQFNSTHPKQIEDPSPCRFAKSWGPWGLCATDEPRVLSIGVGFYFFDFFCVASLCGVYYVASLWWGSCVGSLCIGWAAVVCATFCATCRRRFLRKEMPARSSGGAWGILFGKMVALV